MSFDLTERAAKSLFMMQSKKTSTKIKFSSKASFPFKKADFSYVTLFSTIFPPAWPQLTPTVGCSFQIQWSHLETKTDFVPVDGDKGGFMYKCEKKPILNM